MQHIKRRGFVAVGFLRCRWKRSENNGETIRIVYPFSLVILEVGYKKVMFQGAKGSSSYETECSLEHFDAFFIKIGQKMRRYRLKNQIGWGVQGGLNITILCYYYLSFVPFFTSVEANMLVLRSRNPFLKVLKNKTFFLLLLLLFFF